MTAHTPIAIAGSRFAPTYGSACCLSPLKLGGKGTTHYYLCAKCRKPCDAILVGKCPECRRKTKHEINGVGMWICQRCKLDVTPNGESSDRPSNKEKA